MNRREPNTLLCGTPETIGIHSQVAQSTTTLYLWLKRDSLQIDSTLPYAPIDFNCESTVSGLWLTSIVSPPLWLTLPVNRHNWIPYGYLMGSWESCGMGKTHMDSPWNTRVFSQVNRPWWCVPLINLLKWVACSCSRVGDLFLQVGKKCWHLHLCQPENACPNCCLSGRVPVMLMKLWIWYGWLHPQSLVFRMV